MLGYHKMLLIGVDELSVVLNTLNILVLMAACVVIGFFIGKGKLEVKKKLSPEVQEKIEKAAKEQQEVIDKYNKMMEELSRYSEL